MTINRPTKDKRMFVRVTPAQHAPVQVDINGEGFIEVTKAIDISEGGIRISVKHRFAGCHVDLPTSFIIYLPSPINKHFNAIGRIKHVLGDSFGVQFTHLDSDDRTLIRRYVKSRSSKPNIMDSFLGYCTSLLRMAG